MLSLASVVGPFMTPSLVTGRELQSERDVWIHIRSDQAAVFGWIWERASHSLSGICWAITSREVWLTSCGEGNRPLRTRLTFDLSVPDLSYLDSVDVACRLDSRFLFVPQTLQFWRGE